MQKYDSSYGKTDLFIDSSTGQHELRRRQKRNAGELMCGFIPGRPGSVERAIKYVGCSKPEREAILEDFEC